MMEFLAIPMIVAIVICLVSLFRKPTDLEQ
jgi:hypothetical protein